MANVLKKIKELIGLEEGEENATLNFSDEEAVSLLDDTKARNGKVVNISSAKTTKILISRPKNYESAKEIAEAIKSKKIVVVNTIGLDVQVAQRLVDFISGACFVLNAEVQELEQRIYLLSPNNTEVISDTKNELVNKSFFGKTKEDELQ